MCGRFALHATSQELSSTFGMALGDFRVEARYNIAPGQWILIVRPDRNRTRTPSMARWGLVPSWAKDPEARPRPINARAEGIADKPTFRGALRHGRCLIPASGFFEWRGIGKEKQAHYIHPTDAPVFAFAGLSSTWAGFHGELDTCAIITTKPNEHMAEIHDRMPVILPPEAWEAWLDADTPTREALALLRPCPSERLASHPVPPRVGHVAHDDPGLIEPDSSLQPLLCLVQQGKDIAERALAQYRPEVEALLMAERPDPNHIERLLDGLLDFAFDPAILLLYRRLCRRYMAIDPQAAASYVQAYREMWDGEEPE